MDHEPLQLRWRIARSLPFPRKVRRRRGAFPMCRNHVYRVLATAVLLAQFCTAVGADDPPPAQGKVPTLVRERIAGAFRFPGEEYLRITGIAKVVDAHTLAFDDGTQVELNGMMDAPDLEQFGLIGDALYPCGRNAAEFLRTLIGDRPVVCYVESNRRAKPHADCYLGETRLD